MIESSIFKRALCVSFVGHFLLFGLPGLNLPQEKPQKEIIMDFEFQKAQKLPDIKTVSPDKKLKKIDPPDISEKPQMEDEITQKIEKKEERVSTDLKDQNNLLRYSDMVNRRIYEFIEYPYKAKIEGLAGTARVRFTVLADGRAEDITIIASSGSKLLDAEAVNAVIKASPFMPPPVDDFGENIIIEATLVFQLYGANN